MEGFENSCAKISQRQMFSTSCTYSPTLTCFHWFLKLTKKWDLKLPSPSETRGITSAKPINTTNNIEHLGARRQLVEVHSVSCILCIYLSGWICTDSSTMNSCSNVKRVQLFMSQGLVIQLIKIHSSDAFVSRVELRSPLRYPKLTNAWKCSLIVPA